MLHVRKASAALSGLAVLGLIAMVAPARADITVRPADASPAVATSPVFGPVAPGGIATTQYQQFGLILSDRGAAGPAVDTAIFSDPPLAFGGVNGSGNVDGVSPVDGRFSLLNTTTPGLTDLVEVEAGFSDPGDLLLTLYDINGAILDTRLNGLDGLGPNGRTLILISRLQADVASFRVSTPTNDIFGVNQIRFNTPVAAAPGNAAIPEPGTLGLLASAVLGSTGFVARRRRTMSA